MAFLERIQSGGGNMNNTLRGKISQVLDELEREVTRLQREGGLSVAHVGFLKPCSTVIIADPNLIYVIGSNESAGGVQRVFWAEEDKVLGSLHAAFYIVNREIGLEKLFGIAIPRAEVENSSGANRHALISSVAQRYIDDVKKEIEKSMKIVRMKPIFTGRDYLIDEDLIFCLSPFKDPYNTVFSDHIGRAVTDLNQKYRCIRADNIFDNRPIIEDIWARINRSKVIISDLSERNPNVFYETGIAHTIGKEVVLITQSMDDVPFDLRHLRCIVYEYTPRGMKVFEETLKATLATIVSR